MTVYSAADSSPVSQAAPSPQRPQVVTASSNVPVGETSEAETPVILVDSPSKSWGLIIGGIFAAIFLLCLIGGAVFGWLMWSDYKKETKKVIQNQLTNLEDLGSTYTEIVKATNESTKIQKPKENQQLLGVSTSKEEEQKEGEVLSAEEDLAIQNQRKLIELYKKGQTQATEIERLTNELVNRQKSMPFGLLLPNTSDLVGKTNQFVAQTKSMMVFFEKEAGVSIETYLKGKALGTALTLTLMSEVNEGSITTLEEKLQELKALNEKYAEISTTNVSGDLQQMHAEWMKQRDKETEQIENIIKSLKKGDAQGFATNFIATMFGVVSEGGGDNATTKLVTFWQTNQTVRAVDDVRRDWEIYSEKL